MRVASRGRSRSRLLVALAGVTALTAVVAASATQAVSTAAQAGPMFSEANAFDISMPSGVAKVPK